MSGTLIFDEDISTGAADDLQRATDIAIEMVTRYGMSRTVGQRTYMPPRQTFLPGAGIDRPNASEPTAREIDLAVRDLVEEASARALDILRSRQDDLDQAARLLLEKETVTADEVPFLRRAGTPIGRAA
jgi:cell division protease FtsH